MEDFGLKFETVLSATINKTTTELVETVPSHIKAVLVTRARLRQKSRPGDSHLPRLPHTPTTNVEMLDHLLRSLTSSDIPIHANIRSAYHEAAL